MRSMETLTHEMAAHAARLVVEEGLDYGAAKRRALKVMGVPPRTALPDNDLVESEVPTTCLCRPWPVRARMAA